jgi:hypothetical protein
VHCRACGFVGDLLVRTVSVGNMSSSNLRLVCARCNSSDWFVPRKIDFLDAGRRFPGIPAPSGILMTDERVYSSVSPQEAELLRVLLRQNASVNPGE